MILWHQKVIIFPKHSVLMTPHFTLFRMNLFASFPICCITSASYWAIFGYLTRIPLFSEGWFTSFWFFVHHVLGRSPQICTVTNFREEFWISPLWCLFFCFSLTFGVYVMKKYIPELSYFFSQFSSHIYMSRVRTWQLTFSPNHMKWAFWINKITFFYQHIY